MIIGQDHMLKERQCLSCGTPQDAAAQLGQEGAPEAGDIALCMYCGHLMAFSDDMGFREMTEDEAIDMAGDERIIAFSEAIKQMKEEERLLEKTN